MTIGKHECKIAEGTDLIAAIRIGLDEVLTALEESFHDLTDEQAAAFPIDGRNNIAWTVMHCLQNVDHYANTAPTSHEDMPKRVLKQDDRYDLWQAPKEKWPKPGDDFPAVQQMLDHLYAVRDSAFGILDSKGAENLSCQTRHSPSPRTVVADSYMRTIFHTMAHVRQIWLLRGALGMVDGQSWPQQHWA